MKPLFRILLLLMLVTIAAYSQNTTLSGTMQAPDGTLFNGYLRLSLEQQGAVLSTCTGGPVQVLPGVEKLITITNGAMVGTQKVWGADCMQPSNIPYNVTVQDKNGNTLYKDEWLISGSTYNIGAAVSVYNPNITYAASVGVANSLQSSDGSGKFVANGCIAGAGQTLTCSGSGTFGSIKAASVILNSGSITVDPRSYGAVCDGTDANANADTTAIINATSFINTQPAAKIDFHFPAGSCVIDAALANPVMNITANNVMIEGPGATLRLKTPTVPYNQSYAVATNTWYYWWFIYASGNHITVKDLTFDQNGQGVTNCGGTYGCFWVDGISGTPSPKDLKVLDNTFLTAGWPVLSAGNNTVIRGNYADTTAGMVCENGANGCVIDSNISVNAIDAPYAINGGTTTALYVSNFVVSNNIAVGTSPTTPNGNGIDITAAQDGVVTGNTIIGMSNACIIVDMSNGYYGEGAAGTYIPSQRVIVSGNTCTNNNHYGGWPINGEILVGNYYANNGATPFNPGDTAQDIQVTNNTVTAYNSSANDYGVVVGYGAKNVKVTSNYFNGCGTVASGTCGATPYRIFDTPGTSNIQYVNNHQDSAYAGTIRTQGSGPYEIWGNGMTLQTVSGNPTSSPFVVETTLNVGDNNANNFFPGVINLLGGVQGTNGYSGTLNFVDGNGTIQASLKGSTTNQNLALTLQPNWGFSVNSFVDAIGGYKINGNTVLNTSSVKPATCVVGQFWTYASGSLNSTGWLCTATNVWSPIQNVKQLNSFCTGANVSATAVTFPGLGGPYGTGSCSSGVTAGSGTMLPVGGTLLSLTVRCATTGLNTSSGVFTVYDQPTLASSASATPITLTYGTTAANTAVTDSAHATAFAANDIISVRFTGAGASETIGTCAVNILYQ